MKRGLAVISDKINRINIGQKLTETYSEKLAVITKSLTLEDLYDLTISDNEMPFGLTSSKFLAIEYDNYHESIVKTSNRLIYNELSKMSLLGFLTNIKKDKSTLSNAQIVKLLQLRIINAIACMAGYDIENDEIKQTILKLMPVEILESTKETNLLETGLTIMKDGIRVVSNTKILETVHSFNYEAIIQLATGMLNGLFSTTIDVVTAHGLCKKAQSVFLEDLIEYEEMVRFERLRLKLLVNLLIIDSDISEEDNDLINLLVLESALNDSDKELLLKSLSTKETLKVEISTMEIDYAMALNLLMSIIKLLQINGSMSQIQILYLKKMGSNMGVISGDIDLLIQ